MTHSPPTDSLHAPKYSNNYLYCPTYPSIRSLVFTHNQTIVGYPTSTDWEPCMPSCCPPYQIKCTSQCCSNPRSSFQHRSSVPSFGALWIGSFLPWLLWYSYCRSSWMVAAGGTKLRFEIDVFQSSMDRFGIIIRLTVGATEIVLPRHNRWNHSLTHSLTNQPPVTNPPIFSNTKSPTSNTSSAAQENARN